MNSRRSYGQQDDQPQIVGDKGFVGFESAVKQNVLPEGTLYESINARIEKGEIETRKGHTLQNHDADWRDAFASCRYVNPVGTSDERASIAIAHKNAATIFDPGDKVIEVPYQSGQEANGDADLVESFGSLYLTRGAGVHLPCELPAKLGEYPLEYNGQKVPTDQIEVGDLVYVKEGFWAFTKFDDTEPRDGREFAWVEASDDVDPQYPKLYEVTHVYDSGTIVVKNEQNMRTTRRGYTGDEGVEIDLPAPNPHFHYNDAHKYEKANPVSGLFKMPNASVVIQIYPWVVYSDRDDVVAGRADAEGEPINQCRVDLAPIESRQDQWEFDEDNWIITGSLLNSTTGHQFKDGDLIKIQGTTDYDGVYPVRRHDFNTIIIDDAPIPLEPVERNSGGIAWNESSNLRPADFAVTTANRLAFKGATDLVQFSDVFAPSIVNPFFNRVLVNEGTGDNIIAMLPVQDDSLLVFKRNSIYLITATSTLGDNLRVIEITRQLGCVSRGSIQEVGDLIYFLSDSGLYAVDAGIRNESNIASPIKALEIISTPTSKNIQDKINLIDFKYSDKFISAYTNNRYYLGYVSKTSVDGKIDKVLIYNQLFQKFESIDYIPNDLYPKDFVVAPNNGNNSLWLVTTDSQILECETAASGIDTYYANQEFLENNIFFSVTTRSYDAETYNLKKWHRVGVTVQSVSNNQTNLSFGFATKNPDAASLIFADALKDPYRKTFRVIARKRGQMFSTTITNLLDRESPFGRLKVSEVIVECSETARSSRGYTTSIVNEPTDYDVLTGSRPDVGSEQDLALVSDASVDNAIELDVAIVSATTTKGDIFGQIAVSGQPSIGGSVLYSDKGVQKWININSETEGIVMRRLDENYNLHTQTFGELWESLVDQSNGGYIYHWLGDTSYMEILKSGDYAKTYLPKSFAPWVF